ncbi:MAG: chromosomal replication initiation ATPase DnaA [Cocleimonas sp.]|jgi:chromosomal replication initiation ATPase DnaA
MNQTKLTNKEINEYLAEPIYHPTFTKAYKHIHKAFDSFGRRPACCYITGDSGVGKSTLGKVIYNEIIANTEPDPNANIISVVMVTLKDSTLPDEVRKDILDKLGVDSSGYSGRKLRVLLEKQLKACGVQLIIFDEFQHLVRKYDRDVNRNACNFIKNLIDTTGVPVVLLGTPKGKKLFELYDELRTRFICAGELELMSCESGSALEYFRVYLTDLMRRFPLKTVNLSKGNNPYRVMLATGGNLRALEFILSEVLATHRDSTKKISLEDYQTAYDYVRRKELVTKQGRIIKPFTTKTLTNDLKIMDTEEYMNG